MFVPPCDRTQPKWLFCKVHLAKYTKLDFFIKNICTNQKKAIPLQQN